MSTLEQDMTGAMHDLLGGGYVPAYYEQAAADFVSIAERYAHEQAQNHGGVILTRNQLEAWAGRTLTDDDVARIANAIPHSSIPEAVGVISENL